uniref:Uncharacterized protein n=1 Tax=Anopheles albimanus TaxID=7167 RepID=A0A182FY34_ANOAL
RERAREELKFGRGAEQTSRQTTVAAPHRNQPSHREDRKPRRGSAKNVFPCEADSIVQKGSREKFYPTFRWSAGRPEVGVGIRVKSKSFGSESVCHIVVRQVLQLAHSVCKPPLPRLLVL